MKTIYLHIGGHKTGSTAIQKFLFLNKQWLKNNGFLFPGTVHAHNTIGIDIIRDGASSGDDLTGSMLCQTEFTRDIISEINNSNERKVIISAEFFENLPKNHVFTLKKILDDNINGDKEYTIIYYCRRQDTLIESLYREKIKQEFLEGTGTAARFQDFLKTIPDRDYQKTIKIWADLFGKENIIVQPYEKCQLKDNIFSDFCTKIKLDTGEGYHYPSEQISNVGLSVDLTEFLRLLVNTTHLDRKFRNKLYAILIDINTSETYSPSIQYLSPEERASLLIRCEENNRTVAREYLGRDDGILFYDTFPDKNDPWVPYKGLTIEKIIPVFVRILFEIDRKFKKDTGKIQENRKLPERERC